MVSALKKTEIQTVKEMVDMFKDTMNQAKAELDVIDEKYRKQIEEEKKALKMQFAEAKAQLKVWEKMFSSFDSTMVQEALGYEATATVEETDEPKVETNATAEEAEPVITDTIFPENNEPEDIPEPAPVAEDAGEPVGDPVPDEPAPAPKNLDEEEDDEWNQRIESGELKEVPAKNGMTKEDIVSALEEVGIKPVEEMAVIDVNDNGQWVDAFASEEKKEAPVLVDGDDGWPMPEDWK